MILFRNMKEEDLEFLYKLKKESMGKYIDQVWGWNPESQRKNIIQNLKLKKNLIIIKYGKRAGWLSIFRTKKSIALVNIAILPEYQNKGIGTKILMKLISKSIEQSKDLYLQVLKVNLLAQFLYKRLGLIIISEDNTHFFMKYNSNLKEIKNGKN